MAKRKGRRTKRGSSAKDGCFKVAIQCGKAITCGDSHLVNAVKAARAEQKAVNTALRSYGKEQKVQAQARVKAANEALTAFKAVRAKRVTECRKEIRQKNEDALRAAQQIG